MKAILVVDIPDNYDEYGSGDWYIIADDYGELNIVYEEDRKLKHYFTVIDDMAQLKPMPQKKKNKEIKHLEDFVDIETQYDYIKNQIVGKINYDVEAIFNEGYNSCIDEILGETENE